MSAAATSRHGLCMRGVKQMLTRADIDHRDLTFTERTVTLAQNGGRQVTESISPGPSTFALVPSSYSSTLIYRPVLVQRRP